MLYDEGFTGAQVSITAVLVSVGSIIFYFVEPASWPTETENHGWLEPANEPFPADSNCGEDVRQARPNGMLFSLGKPGVWFSKTSGGSRPLLTVGACTLMSAEFEGDQMLFNADIYDRNHELVARIERNEFHLIPSKYAYQTRPDRSTLNVYDKEGKLLVTLRYRSKEAIDVSGNFSCSDGREAKAVSHGELTMTGPKGAVTADNLGCLVNTGGFVVGDYGFSIGPTPCWALDPNDNSVSARYARNVCRARGEPTAGPATSPVPRQ
jgi:hypothetical protein